MNVKDFSRGLSLGILAGSVITGLVLHKPVQNLLKSDKRFKTRQKDMFDYMITTMGPYVPKHVLEQMLEYIQFDSIATHEDGML